MPKESMRLVMRLQQLWLLLIGLGLLKVSAPDPTVPSTSLSSVLLSRTLRIYRQAGPGRVVVLAVDETDDVDRAVHNFCDAYAISAPRCRYLKASTAAEAAEKERAAGRERWRSWHSMVWCVSRIGHSFR